MASSPWPGWVSRKWIGWQERHGDRPASLAALPARNAAWAPRPGPRSRAPRIRSVRCTLDGLGDDLARRIDEQPELDRAADLPCVKSAGRILERQVRAQRNRRRSRRVADPLRSRRTDRASGRRQAGTGGYEFASRRESQQMGKVATGAPRRLRRASSRAPPAGSARRAGSCGRRPAPAVAPGPGGARRAPKQRQLTRDRARLASRLSAVTDQVLALEHGQHLPGALTTGVGKSRELADVDAVRPVGAPGSSRCRNTICVADLAHRDVEVAQRAAGRPRAASARDSAWRTGLAADRVVQVLGDRPRDATRRRRCGAAPDLVEQHQAPRRRGVEDGAGLGHLHHERGLARARDCRSRRRA